LERAVVFGILFVFLFAMVVSIIEYFIPLNMKFEMNAFCRDALFSMETKGELKDEDRNQLIGRLSAAGFKNISVQASGESAYGGRVGLRVEADYEYSKLTGVFARQNVTQRMVFDKTVAVRKVVN